MKKFLALVLALVMTMSLVTISAGAEDFTDDSKITYDEAVDVMTAIGVVGGYADGSFNPQGTLTRGAAAKIICNMILGPTAADALATVEAPFKDVPADHVFSGYIAYCASEGIVGGYTDGTFKPAGTLTGYAFMKMLLGALGYDAVNEGYTGANFAINVAKRALNIGLDDGLTSDFVGTKALTREEACLYAFNALNAQMVEYNNDSKITIGDIVISNSSKAEGKTKTVTSGSTTTTVPVLFRDEFFKDLKNNGTPSTDAFNRAATTWYNGKAQTTDNTIGTYTTAADYTVIAKEAYSDAKAAFVDLVDKKFAKALDAASVNGGADNTAAAVVAGDVIEFYMADDGDIKNAVITRYEIGKITKVDTKLTKAQKEDGNTCKVTIDGVGSATDVTALLDGKIAGFDAETYVKDAYVLYVVKSGEIIASELPATVEGKITATKSTSPAKVAVDGVYYVDLTSAAYGDEGIYYMDKAGQLIASESTAAKSENYAYIYNVDVNTTGKDADGRPANVVTVYYVTVDGTKASAVAKAELDGSTWKLDDGDSATYTGTVLTHGAAAGVVAYSIDADGKFVEEAAADKIAAMGTGSVKKTNPVVDNGLVATDDTTFVFVWFDSVAGAYKTKVVTGYKNVNVGYAANGTASAVAMGSVYDNDTDKQALYTFVAAKNGSVDNNFELAVLLSGTPAVTKNADKNTVYTYDVVIDGVETTLSFETTAIVSAAAGKVIDFKMVGDYAVEDTDNTVYTGVVASKGAGYFVANSTYFSTADADVYTITMEYEDSTRVELESVTVSEGAIFDAADPVYYTIAAGETNVVSAVYVVEYVD